MPMNDAPTLPRALLPAIVAAALLLIVVLLGHALKPLLNRPVQTLRIDGALSHLQPAQVVETAAIAPGARLFDVDLDALRTRLQGLPWVAHARVSRVWPGRIAVHLWERKPYALWGDAGLVDEEGVAFTPPAQDLPQGLPHLAGPNGRVAEVMQAYQVLTQALAGSAFVPDGLRLDPRGSWTMHTVGGIELRLGEDDPRSKIVLLQGAVLHTLAEKLDQVAYVDLRYSNGFSVGWKPAPAPLALAVAKPAARPAHPARAAGSKPR